MKAGVERTLVVTRLRLIPLGVLLCLSALARGEEPDRSRKFGTARTYGVAVSQPLGLSVSAGVVIGTVPAKPVRCGLGYWTNGAFIQIEPGIGGGKASLGLATSNVMGGMAVKSSYVRTWGKSWGTASGTSYAGGEVEFAAVVRVQAGWLWKVGRGPGRGNMFTWGIGFGL